MTPVSVVIPTRDRRETVLRAVRSALSQTHPLVEIVVVDDGSTDGTAEAVAREFPSARLLRQENRGCAAARNAGVRATRGAYLAFLDDDDLLEPDALARGAALLDARPEIDLVYADCLQFEGDAPPSAAVRARSVRADEHPGALAAALFLDSTLAMSAVLLRREAGDAAGWFREDLRHNEDTDFLIRAAAGRGALWLPEPACRVRVHRGGKSADRLAIARALWRSESDLWRSLPALRETLGGRGRRRLRDLAADLLGAAAASGDLGLALGAARALGASLARPRVVRRAGAAFRAGRSP